MTKTLFVLLLTLLASGSAAYACSCIGSRAPEKQQIAAAYQRDALIFVGRVLRVDTVATTDTVRVADTGPPEQRIRLQRHESLRYTFAVSRLLKGQVSGPTVLVSSEIQSSMCGKRFAVGSEQLVYGFLVSEQAAFGGEPLPVEPYYATSICHRSQELHAVRKAELKQLARLARAR